MVCMGFTVPIIWAVLVLFAALTALLLYLGLFQDRSRGRPRCPKCWYNMTGAPSLVCPECGHDARSPRRLHRTRRRRWAVVLAVLTAFCCYYSWLVKVRVAELKEPVVAALRPTAWLLLTLQTAPPPQFDLLHQRVRRFGFWPWETRLFLLNLDRILSGSGSPGPLLMTLAIDARRSDKALDHLVELHKHPNPAVANAALWWSSCLGNRLREDQITALLDCALSRTKSTPYGWTGDFEQLLAEMIRRNRLDFREQVARWVANPPMDTTFNIKGNLELLAALRRMEGKPDPLHIFVSGSQVVECTTATLPTIEVSIRNVDVGKEAVGFQVGGDYRSGRQARWRFEVRDEEGNLTPAKPQSSGRGGGRFLRKMLEFGQSYETKLEMGKYVEPLTPGRYRVTVLYHDWFPIADMEYPNLILFSSDPFELIVRPGGTDSQPASR